MDKVDFIIPWVDGSDEAWRAEFAKYHSAAGMEDASTARYRDWDNLHYWFRGVEKFAPWVGRIHFITWGHLPPWLNREHPQLNIVRHGDILEKKYLPVFNINPLEISLHRIAGLAERFVYFNDDCFLGQPVAEERFFRGGLPCDTARLSIIPPSSIGHIIMNDVALINARHAKKQAMRGRLGKWFNYRYGVGDMLKTLTLMPWSSFAGFKDPHMPQPFLRSTFERLWDEQAPELTSTLNNRFRSLLDYNQYLFRYEQLATGQFVPASGRDTRLELLGEENIEDVCRFVRAQKYSMFCLNDSNEIRDFDAVRNKLNAALQDILPEKSAYEL